MSSTTDVPIIACVGIAFDKGYVAIVATPNGTTRPKLHSRSPTFAALSACETWVEGVVNRLAENLRRAGREGLIVVRDAQRRVSVVAVRKSA